MTLSKLTKNNFLQILNIVEPILFKHKENSKNNEYLKPKLQILIYFKL